MKLPVFVCFALAALAFTLSAQARDRDPFTGLTSAENVKIAECVSVFIPKEPTDQVIRYEFYAPVALEAVKILDHPISGKVSVDLGYLVTERANKTKTMKVIWLGQLKKDQLLAGSFMLRRGEWTIPDQDIVGADNVLHREALTSFHCPKVNW